MLYDDATAFWTLGAATIVSALFFLLARQPTAPARQAGATLGSE